MKMEKLLETKLDLYAKVMRKLKDLILKKLSLLLLEWRQSECFLPTHASKISMSIKWT